MYLDEPVPFAEDDKADVRETQEVVNGTPIINYGGKTPLYNGDANCKHEIVGGDNCSGIKCRKCNGWYCA